MGRPIIDTEGPARIAAARRRKNLVWLLVVMAVLVIAALLLAPHLAHPAHAAAW